MMQLVLWIIQTIHKGRPIAGEVGEDLRIPKRVPSEKQKNYKGEASQFGNKQT